MCRRVSVSTEGLQPSDVEALKDRVHAIVEAEWKRLEAEMASEA